MKFRISPTFYESFLDDMLDGFALCQMVFDKQGQPVDWIYLKVNKNFEKLTGLKNVVGKKVTALIPGIAKSNPELLEVYGQASLTRKPMRFETYVEPLARWFLVSVSSPKKKFFVAIFQNITEQKQIGKDLEDAKIAARNVLEDLQIEKATLASAKAQEDAMLASIGEGIIAMDLDRRIVIMNKAAEKLLGWKINEAIGKFYNDIISLEDEKGTFVPPDEGPLARAFSHPTTSSISTFYLLSKNNIKFPVVITISPIILHNKIIGVAEVFRDITKEKEIERLRLDFLSLASHQLRTPLSGTKWLLETMNRGVIGPVTEKQKEYLAQLYIINERMIRLVFNMLNALRLEGTPTVVKKEVIHVSEVFQDLRISTEAAAKSKHITLQYPLNHRMLTLETDPEIVKVILECFVSNAINYSDPGKEVVIGLQEEASVIVFFVKDSGIGIPKEEQKRIFERFYRASNAKVLKPDGTGLGLYIALMLAEKIGAKVSFESEEHKGSIFYLRILKKLTT